MVIICPENTNFAAMNTIELPTQQLGIGTATQSLTPSILVGDTMRIPTSRLYIIMVTAGQAVIEIDGHDHTVARGSLVYVIPHHLLMLRSCSDSFQTAYACFTFEMLSDFPLLLRAQLAYYVGDHPCCTLSQSDYELLSRYYDLLIDRYHSAYASIDIIKGLLFSFVMETNRIYSGQSCAMLLTHQDKLTDSFFRLLHIYFTTQHSVFFYAQRLCVSDKHLMRVIKKKTGQTFHFWITDFLLRQAKLLLLSTDMNVTQIAEALHFTDSSAFAKFFRKGTGSSPLAYRAQHAISHASPSDSPSRL